ncbi:MAG: hypothetical protein ACR2HB_08650 [Dehalococcoidia bacterium]
MRLIITNNTYCTTDVSRTAVIDLAPGVAVSGSVQVSTGSAVVQGSQIVWTAFSLSGGQQATATINLVANAGGAAVASGAPSIRSVSVEAVDVVTGQRIVEQSASGGPAVAALLAAGATPPSATVANGSAAVAAAAPATTATAPVSIAPAAVQAGGAAVAVVGPQPAPAAAAPPALPRTGDPTSNSWILPALLAGLTALAIGSLLIYGSKRPV